MPRKPLLRKFIISVSKNVGGGMAHGHVFVTLDEEAQRILDHDTDRQGELLEPCVGLGAAFIVSDQAKVTAVREVENV